MASSRTTNQLRTETAAYIAGLIDGEGTITLTRSHAGRNRQVMVSIANTELPMLQYVQRQLGVGKITGKRTVSERHTPSYCHAVANRQALSLLEQVLPYLQSHKRRRAELILADYVKLTPRNGKYTTSLSARRAAFENAVLATTHRAPACRPCDQDPHESP